MSAVKAKDLLADGVQVLVVRALTLVGTASVSILVSRTLGPQGRGVYVIPGIIASFIATMFAGLSTSVSASMLKEKSGRGALRAGFVAAVPLVAVGSLAAAGFTIAMHEEWAAPYAAAALPFMALGALVNGYAYGIGNVRAVAAFSMAGPIVTLALLAGGFFFIGVSPRVAVPMWLAANALISLAGIATVLWSARKIPRLHVPTWPFLTYTLKVGATGIVSMLNYRVDLYIVAALTPHRDLGYYTTAISAAETLLVASQVAAIVTVPHIGALSRDEAADLTARCVRNNFIFVGLCGLVGILVAPFAVNLLYGSAFSPAVTPLRILIVGVIPWSAAGMISSYYTLNGRRPQVALSTAAGSALACAVISVILVPRMGITGAAIATAATYWASVVVMIAYFSKQTKISIARVMLFQPEDLQGYRRIALSLLSRPVTGVERRSGT
jgi:O-antigen/teichoic acid export membrane protein